MAAVVGIAAALVAYGVSSGVRHAVGHAEHSVKHTVTNIFDHDHPGRDDRKPRPAQHRRLRSGAAVHARIRQGGSRGVT
jgi:hypothetical protein